MSQPFKVDAAEIEGATVQLPGATSGGLSIQLLNADVARGMIASIIHLEPGASIPAHRHDLGAEAHFVLGGDLIDAGRTFGPGAYLTHAAGVVHGPHSSNSGCRVLTVRDGGVTTADHHVVDAEEIEGTTRGNLDHLMVNRADARGSDVPEGEKTAATLDNPTNPTSG